MIDRQYFFDQPVKNELITYGNVWKTATGQSDDYATGCLLDCLYFKEHYNLVAIDFSKKQVLDADPKAINKFYWKFRESRKYNSIFQH